MRDVSARDERVAENEARFREANERLRARFEVAANDVERLPFLCECGHARCTRVVFLTPGEYRHVRQHPARFAVLPGHQILDTEVVTERGDGYEVVEKVGRSREIVEALFEGDDRG
jgi:hypothetical protein